MPLKINLYHEVLRTKKHAQYDPLRLSMYGLIAIVAGMAIWYGIALGTTSSVVGETNREKAEYDKLVPQEKAAKREEEELSKQIAQAEILSKRIEDRFYWAPVWEDITSVVPPNVQLNHWTGEIAPDATRKVTMVIEGIAAGEVPRQVAEDLRVSISEKLAKKYFAVSTPQNAGGPGTKVEIATFRSLDDGTEKSTFEGKKLDTANFAISVTFLPKAPVEAAPASTGRAGRTAGVAKAETPSQP